MIWYLLKKLLIVLSNTWTFLSLFLANSLFGIAALKKKRAKHTPRVSQASGNPRRYLKRGRAFRLAAFQRNFASTRSTKVYAFRFVQENLFIFFFSKKKRRLEIFFRLAYHFTNRGSLVQKEGRIFHKFWIITRAIFARGKKNVVPFGFSVPNQ